MSSRPNAEMVAIAWAKTIPGVDATKVATVLPADAASWAATGFVQVEAVGGSPAVETQMRHPVVTFTAWAVNPNSQKTPWGQAQALAERVFDAFYKPALFQARFTFGTLDYLAADLHTGYPLTEPRKIKGNEASYAQVTFDALLTWTAGAG